MLFLFEYITASDRFRFSSLQTSDAMKPNFSGTPRDGDKQGYWLEIVQSASPMSTRYYRSLLMHALYMVPLTHGLTGGGRQHHQAAGGDVYPSSQSFFSFIRGDLIGQCERAEETICKTFSV